MVVVKNIPNHVSAETAGWRRKHYQKKTHVILKGGPCLAVRDGAQSQTTYRALRVSEILAKTNNSLTDIHTHFAVPHDAGSLA
jgi:hypothetical protein